MDTAPRLHSSHPVPQRPLGYLGEIPRGKLLALLGWLIPPDCPRPLKRPCHRWRAHFAAYRSRGAASACPRPGSSPRPPTRGRRGRPPLVAHSTPYRCVRCLDELHVLLHAPVNIRV